MSSTRTTKITPQHHKPAPTQQKHRPKPPKRYLIANPETYRRATRTTISPPGWVPGTATVTKIFRLWTNQNALHSGFGAVLGKFWKIQQSKTTRFCISNFYFKNDELRVVTSSLFQPYAPIFTSHYSANLRHGVVSATTRRHPPVPRPDSASSAQRRHHQTTPHCVRP